MQNIRNFKKIVPTPRLLAEGLAIAGKTFDYLISEDGQDWYECQRSFAKDTVKIMYDSNGVIRSVVAEPVTARGGILAVSALPGPENCSVAEVDGPLPDGFEIGSGTWIFDGVKIVKSESLFTGQTTEANARKKNRLLIRAAVTAFVLQSSEVTGNARDGDAENLLLLQYYTDALRGIDVTQGDPAWPSPPEFMR